MVYTLDKIISYIIRCKLFFQKFSFGKQFLCAQKIMLLVAVLVSLIWLIDVIWEEAKSGGEHQAVLSQCKQPAGSPRTGRLEFALCTALLPNRTFSEALPLP